MKIFIVIPVHNRKNLTRNCLLSLYRQTYKDFKIIICDDGSTDGTKEMIKKQFPEVVLLKGNGNLYWSGAYNKCLTFVFEKADEKDYILSLNNDVEVDENYLFELCKAAKDNSDKLIMSVAYDKENRSKIVDPGYNVNPVTMRQHSIRNTSLDTKYIPVNSVCGRGLLIPVKIAKKAGFADEKHFLQMGDYDLSFRYQKLRIKAVISNETNIYSGPSHTVERYFNNYSLKNFLNYITDIKSAGNLRYRFWAVVKNRPLYLIPINLFFDINCIIFGYFKRWILKKINNR